MSSVSIATLQRYPTIKYDLCNWAKCTFRHRAGQCSTLCSKFIIINSWNHFYHYCCHLFVGLFYAQITQKNKLLLLFIQNYQERKGDPYMELSPDKNQKRKNLLILKIHMTMIKKIRKVATVSSAYIILHFSLSKYITSLSSQCAICFTHDLQHFSFLG